MGFNSVQYYEFGKKRGVINLIIKGVGINTINTKADLTSRFTFLENQIRQFYIIGNDVYCEITSNYNGKGTCFNGNTYITEIIETGRLKVLTFNAFANCPNLIKVELLGATSLNASLSNNTNLSFNNIKLPELITISDTSSFRALKNDGGTLDLPKVTVITGAACFRGMSGRVNLNTITKLTGWNILDQVSIIFYMPLLQEIGNTTGLDLDYPYLPGNLTLVIPSLFQTNNGGEVEGDLVPLISAGKTIVYIANFTAPNPITNLTIGNVYATAIQLIDNGTNTNAIDYYESVKVNGISYANVPVNGYITNLTPNTSYTIEAIAVDIFYNKSTSNIVTQTTSATYVIPTANLVSYYKFNDNVLDSWGANNGTATDITYASGKSDNAGVFNGTTSNSLVPYNANLSFTNGTIDLPFSISFYVKHTVNGNVIYIAKTNGTARTWEIIRESNTLVFRLSSNGDSANRIEKYLSWTPVIGQWYHITATYNGNKSVSGMNLYIDNVSIGLTRTIGSTYLGLINNTNPCIIGKYTTITNYTLNGALDGLAIFNKELSDIEVAEIYTKQNAGNELI